MAKVTLTNTGAIDIMLPDPFFTLLHVGEALTFNNVSIRKMEESPAFCDAVNRGLFTCAVEPDPSIPDMIEQASLGEVTGGLSGVLVFSEDTSWADVWSGLLRNGGQGVVLVVGSDDGTPLPMTAGDTYDFSGVYFLGVPGTSGQAKISLQEGVVLAVGGLLRSKDVFWTWEAANLTPVYAYSMSLELDGGGLVNPNGAANACMFQTSNYGINTVKMVNGAIIDGSLLTAPLAVFQANYTGIVPPRPIFPMLREPLPILPPRPRPPRPWPPFPPPPRPPHYGINFTLLESNILGSVVHTPINTTNNSITADTDSAFDTAINFTGGAGVSVVLLGKATQVGYDDGVVTPALGVGPVQEAVDVLKQRGSGWLLSCHDIGNAAETIYLGHGFTTSTQLDFPAPHAGVLKGIGVWHNTANGNGNVVRYQVKVNDSYMGNLDVSLATGVKGSVSSFSPPLDVNAMDRICIEIQKAVDIGSGVLDLTLFLEFA